MAVTVNGEPWPDFRPWGEGTPTHAEINEKALAPASRIRGYCLCLHPMNAVIDFTGFSCAFCDQPVTAESSAEEARSIRGMAIAGAFPELRKK